MRNLESVIDQMLAVVPATEKLLIAKLKNRKESFLFSPPEHIGLWWKETAIVLANQLGDRLHTEGWKKQVQDIWMDRK